MGGTESAAQSARQPATTGPQATEREAAGGRRLRVEERKPKDGPRPCLAPARRPSDNSTLALRHRRDCPTGGHIRLSVRGNRRLFSSSSFSSSTSCFPFSKSPPPPYPTPVLSLT